MSPEDEKILYEQLSTVADTCNAQTFDDLLAVLRATRSEAGRVVINRWMLHNVKRSER